MGPIEQDFDPTEYSAEFVAVEQDETIPSILDRVGEALGRTPNVVLIIPRGSQAFHTTQDFLALGKLQWAGEVRVAVASPDPTIAGLARVLGFHIVEPPLDHPALAGDPSLDRSSGAVEGDERDIEQPTSPLPLGGVPEWVISPALPVITRPSSSLTTSTWLNMPGDTPAQSRGTQTATRSGMPPPRTKPRQTGVLLPTHIGEAPPLTPVVDPAKVDDPKTEDGDAKARRAVLDANAYRNRRKWRYNSGGRSMRWGRLLAVFSVLLVVSLVAGSTYAYVYLPEATISVRPLEKMISTLPVQVTVLTQAAPGGGQQNGTPSGGTTSANGGSINGISLSAPLAEEAAAPATGTRQVPTGKAHGSMHFANRTSLAKSVPAGTQFTEPNGVIVQTTQGVTVPPTDLLGGTIGRADAPVVANVEGPDGNLAAGQLSGLYGDALEYTSSALTGGGVAVVKVVAQADIDGLVASLTSKMQSQVAGVVAKQVQAGQQLITQTVALADVQVTTDHKAGQDGDSVDVKLTATARAFAYNVNEMDDAITQLVYHWVSSPSNLLAEAGPSLDPRNVRFDAPALVSVDKETGQVIYSTSASALVKFTLTPAMQSKIVELVKGQDIQKAQELIQQTYSGIIDTQSIQARVLWFNVDKLPSDPAHIVVQLASSANSSPAVGSAAPAAQQTTNTARPQQR